MILLNTSPFSNLFQRRLGFPVLVNARPKKGHAADKTTIILSGIKFADDILHTHTCPRPVLQFSKLSASGDESDAIGNSSVRYVFVHGGYDFSRSQKLTVASTTSNPTVFGMMCAYANFCQYVDVRFVLQSRSRGGYE